MLTAYGFSAKKDLLGQLLDLNLAVAARIEAGQPVVAPGIPPSYPDGLRLMSDDCIRAGLVVAGGRVCHWLRQCSGRRVPHTGRASGSAP